MSKRITFKTDGVERILITADGREYWDLSENGNDISGMLNQKNDISYKKTRTVWVNFYDNGGALHFDSEMDADTNHLYVRESEYHHNYPRIGNRAYPVEIEE